MSEVIALTTTVIYHVVAYNESWAGYGDNASRDFTNEEEAVEYARKLPPHLIRDASIWKETKVSGRESVKIENWRGASLSSHHSAPQGE